jgi:cell wall-associated NlpC family hydrolase
MTDRERLVAAARTQLGVRYYSMHWGPKGSAIPGWGCAMFVAWCHQQVFGTDYYGSCWNFAGDALGSKTLNQGGGQFRFVSASEAKPGDCVLYGVAGYDGRDADDYGHIALYIGNGRVIGAMGRGVPGASNYLTIGIKETSVAAQNIGGVTRYIRCTRLSDTDKEAFPVKETITVKSDSVNVRTAPSTKTGKVVASYAKGDKVNIDGVALGDGFVWGTYIGSTSGQRRYVALGPTSIAGV